MFYCTEELHYYMKKKRRRVLSVEVASSDRSDVEVTEIFLRLVKDDFAEYLKEKKRYRSRELYLREPGAGAHPGNASEPIPVGEVLLPPYKLEIAEDVVFGLKKILFFDKMTVDGVRL